MRLHTKQLHLLPKIKSQLSSIFLLQLIPLETKPGYQKQRSKNQGPIISTCIVQSIPTLQLIAPKEIICSEILSRFLLNLGKKDILNRAVLIVSL